jgi:hypothetical protein
MKNDFRKFVIGFTVFNKSTKSFSFTRLTSRLDNLSIRKEQQAHFLVFKYFNSSMLIENYNFCKIHYVTLKVDKNPFDMLG